MLTPPAISTETIAAVARAGYGLPIADAAFLPIGADVNSAVYRVTTDAGADYFLKLRSGAFEDVAPTVAAFLHAERSRTVMAPRVAVTGRLWLEAHGFHWLLYPFFAGQDGWDVPLSPAQWIAFGASLRAVHTAQLPAELYARLPRERYAPHWRAIVQAFTTEAATRTFDDPIAARLAHFWITRRDTITTMLARTDRLAHALQKRGLDLVVCHADIHAGNVLLGADDTLAIVDWDAPVLAPKERDLMFIGAGIGDVWNTAEESALFYQGYGPAAIDPAALAYYRYERIVEDLAAYGEQIFGGVGSAEDRHAGLRQLTGQFRPDGLVDIAHRTYAALAEAQA